MIELVAMLATQPPQPPPAALEPPPSHAAPDYVDRIQHAEQLIVASRFEEARTLLLALDKAPTGERAADNQVQFLLGLLSMQEQDFESAVSRFRRILVNEPGSMRVRLEMGRALFLGGRLADAERQFMYARAGNVPGGVLANIDRFLIAIRQKRRLPMASPSR